MRGNVGVWAVAIVIVMLAVSCGGPVARPGATSAPAATTAATQSNTATPGGAGQTVEVIVRDFEFAPKTLTVKKGTTVKWTNQGQTKHTITADDGKSFDNAVTPGQTFTFTFDKAGTFAYYCSIHGGPGGKGMSGTVTVEE